jgi:glutaredoxin
LKTFLTSWAIEYNITHSSLSALLKGMQRWHGDLPTCAASLLKGFKCKPTSLHLEKGEMQYYGIKNQLVELIKKSTPKIITQGGSLYTQLYNKAVEFDCKLVTLVINIDGIPLFKSSGKSLWPILCYANEYSLYPFICGAYYGASKPQCLSTFLDDFVTEINSLLNTVHVINGSRFYVTLYAIICDAPARCFLKGTKQYSGYYGCDFCKERGKYLKEYKKIIYVKVDALERTDGEFRNFQEENHQLRESPLMKINDIGMISQIPPDSMHLVYLGVMRRLLNIWCRQILTPSFRIQLSSKLQEFGKSLPYEFKRKTRGLTHLDRWKATEFRTFVLYVGPASLKPFLSKDHFRHFLLLHFSVSVMASQQYNVYLPNAHACLLKFVQDIPLMYGEEQSVYNVHCLIHLAQYVESLGLLDFWGAFKFENFLQIVKRRVRAPTNILAQIGNRFSELSGADTTSSNEKRSSCKVNENDFFVTNTGLLRCISYDGNVIFGNICNFHTDLYKWPYPSSNIGIGLYSVSSDTKYGKMLSKCIAFPTESKYIVFPFVCDTM